MTTLLWPTSRPSCRMLSWHSAWRPGQVHWGGTGIMRGGGWRGCVRMCRSWRRRRRGYGSAELCMHVPFREIMRGLLARHRVRRC